MKEVSRRSRSTRNGKVVIGLAVRAKPRQWLVLLTAGGFGAGPTHMYIDFGYSLAPALRPGPVVEARVRPRRPPARPPAAQPASGLPRGQCSGPWLFSTAEARTSNSPSPTAGLNPALPGLPRDQFSGPWLFSTAEARTSNSSS